MQLEVLTTSAAFWILFVQDETGIGTEWMFTRLAALISVSPTWLDLVPSLKEAAMAFETGNPSTSLVGVCVGWSAVSKNWSQN